jgi:DNA repair protein RadC
VKPATKSLIARFGNLKGILDAEGVEVAAVNGVGPSAATVLRVIREVACLYAQQGAEGRDCLLNVATLDTFWRTRIGSLPYEVFEVGYLDSGYRLLRDGVEQLERGISDRASVYPRRVMEAALRRQAAALVFAHNHPNGLARPSEEDEALTSLLVRAAGTLQIRVFDHLIVTADEVFSFRRSGLL